MSKIRLEKTFMAGFVATAAATALLYTAVVFGMPYLDVAGLLGALLNHGSPPAMESGFWWAGMVWHFINGTFIFALIYAYLLEPRLHGVAWVRGAIWGAVIWLVWEVIGLPLIHMGFFGIASAHAATAILGLLAFFLIYGGLLASVYTDRSMDPTKREWHNVAGPQPHS